MIRALTTLLNVANGERTARFYCDKLGFRIDNRFDTDAGLMWAQLSCGGVRLMINVSAEYAARPPREDARTYDDVVLHFAVDDARALHQELTQLGLAPGPVERQAYGLYEFTLRDPDGYELAFGSPAH